MGKPVTLVLLGSAAVAPIFLAPTGADYDLRIFAQTDLGGSYNPEPVSVVAPYVMAGGTGVAYVAGAIAQSCNVTRQTSAMMQGMVGTVLVVGLTKWGAGRNWPNGGRDPHATDRLDHPEDARDFAPFGRGLHAAFPSGHTAIMFAAAAAFRASAPPGVWWRFVGYPLAVAVGIGMWWGDHHWASDVLSGGLLGEAIGGAAGRAWFPEPDAQEAWHPARHLAWALLPAKGGGLLHVGGEF
jgi:membrane-associated phospholipid phosphatase